MSKYPANIHRDLILKCQAGDAIAFERLYKLYAQAMYNICRRIMGVDDDAQDVLQESFIDAFRKLPELRDIDYFSAWIKRIVTNNCINALRKKRLETSSLEGDYDLIEEEDDFDYSKYQYEQVRMAIDRLPEGCRTVLNLYVFEGYDHKEIGEILSISESASKAQYCKAKGRIRKMLNQTGVRHVG